MTTPLQTAIIIAILLCAGCSSRRVDVESDNSSTVSNAGNIDARTDGGGPHLLVQYFPQRVHGVDLLFVIDNSGSMHEKQVNLTTSFPSLLGALRHEMLGDDGSGRPCSAARRSGCAFPNLHIGAISTDLGTAPVTSLPSCEVPGGDGGKLQNTARIAGCTPPQDRYISFIEGEVNVPGAKDPPQQAVEDAFACIARLGTGGCGFEQPLEAARLALGPTNTINQGFLRDGALLAIVFVTDEDDCSVKNTELFDPTHTALTDPLGPLNAWRCFEKGIRCDINDRFVMGPREDCVPAYDWLYDYKTRYRDFFVGLKPPGRVLIAAIAGPTDRVEVGREGGNPSLRQSCLSAQGIAIPAIRIEALIEAMPLGDAQFTSICEAAGFGPALQALGKKILRKMGTQCVAAPMLTSDGGLACQEGDRFAPGSTCRRSCLHEASCDVIEIFSQGMPDELAISVEKCPTSMWYPGDWRADRDCKDRCPCWRLVKKGSADCDPAAVGTPYALDILREDETNNDSDESVVAVRCATAAGQWGSGELGELSQCCESCP